MIAYTLMAAATKVPTAVEPVADGANPWFVPLIIALATSIAAGVGWIVRQNFAQKAKDREREAEREAAFMGTLNLVPDKYRELLNEIQEMRVIERADRVRIVAEREAMRKERDLIAKDRDRAADERAEAARERDSIKIELSGLRAQIAEMGRRHSDQLEDMRDEHSDHLEKMSADHAEQIEMLNKQIQVIKQQNAGLKAQNEELLTQLREYNENGGTGSPWTPPASDSDSPTGPA